MDSLLLMLGSGQVVRDYFLCGCPATFASPAEFCPICQREWEDWLDALGEERAAEVLCLAGAFASEGGVL